MKDHIFVPIYDVTIPKAKLEELKAKMKAEGIEEMTQED